MLIRIFFFILKFIPKIGSQVVRGTGEKSPSQYKEGRIDTPIHAITFLKRFAKQNDELLKKLNVVIRKRCFSI